MSNPKNMPSLMCPGSASALVGGPPLGRGNAGGHIKEGTWVSAHEAALEGLWPLIGLPELNYAIRATKDLQPGQVLDLAGRANGGNDLDALSDALVADVHVIASNQNGRFVLGLPAEIAVTCGHVSGPLLCFRLGEFGPDARPILGAELLPGDFPAALTLDEHAQFSGGFAAPREDLVEVLLVNPALLRQNCTLCGFEVHAPSYRNASARTSVTHSACRLEDVRSSDNAPMDDQVESLRRLCDREGGYKAVGVALGVNPQTIYQIYAGIKLPSGNPRGVGPTLRRKLNEIYPGWMDDKVTQVSAPTNVSPVTTRGRVPVISWVAAGALGEIEDMFQPGEADEWVETSETKPGRGSFALRVTGDSMTSPYPGDDSFPDGTIIIVDPARSCDAGNFVIAKDVVTQQATFKKLVHDGGRWFLKPLNPAYPTMEIDDPALRMIGRVIESHTRRKL